MRLEASALGVSASAEREGPQPMRRAAAASGKPLLFSVGRGLRHDRCLRLCERLGGFGGVRERYNIGSVIGGSGSHAAVAPRLGAAHAGPQLPGAHLHCLKPQGLALDCAECMRACRRAWLLRTPYRQHAARQRCQDTDVHQAQDTTRPRCCHDGGNYYAHTTDQITAAPRTCVPLQEGTWVGHFRRAHLGEQAFVAHVPLR